MDLPATEFVWGFFIRGLGVVFLVAFASLYRDILPIAGQHGYAPLAPQLDAMRRDYGVVRRLVRFPTVFFLSASDRALRGATMLGMIAALFVIAGVGSTPALIVCWMLYLSFAQALDYFYPWDLLLLEAGALSVFLPSLLPLPELAALEAPFPPIAWAYRWLLFRVVFGFGKYKFFGPGKLHLDYLSSFMISQPLSTPLALRAAKLVPRIGFAVALGVLFLIEVPTPFLIFGPEPARLFAMCAIASLMIGIQLSGNFGFFNLASLVLCIPLLDARASFFDASLTSMFWPIDHLLGTLFASFLFVAGLICLPFNSWIAQSWPRWPSLEQKPVVRWITAMFRGTGPFHLVHAFGVFSPESGPPLKWVPVIEGTRDGVNWLAYRYRYMPSATDSPGRFVAPRMPRFDHALIYDALGISLTNLTASVFAVQNPYRFSRSGWMERLAQRLIEGHAEVRGLFLHDPFADAPPIAIRVRLANFALDPDGANTWRIDYVGTHLPEQRRDPTVFERWIPSPDLFHWDERASRRESRAWRKRIDDAEKELEMSRLFDVVVPLARARDLTDSEALDEVTRAFHGTFDVATRDALESLVARIAWRVASAFERAGATENWFDLGLLAHRTILEGRAFTERALEDPEAALCSLGRPIQTRGGESVTEIDLARGLRLFCLFRPEVAHFQARKARVRELTLRGAARDPHPIAPGFLRHLPALADWFTDPDEGLVGYYRNGHAWRAEPSIRREASRRERATADGSDPDVDRVSRPPALPLQSV